MTCFHFFIRLKIKAVLYIYYTGVECNCWKDKVEFWKTYRSFVSDQFNKMRQRSIRLIREKFFAGECGI